MVTDDLFSIVESLFDKWKTGKSRHYEDWVVEALKKEDVTDENMETIKQYLVGFATETKSVKLFRDTVSVLALYKDESLLPLYQGWLNKYFRECLLAGSTLNSLLSCIESTGQKVRDDETDKNDWSTNLEASREYIIEKMKLIV